MAEPTQSEMKTAIAKWAQQYVDTIYFTFDPFHEITDCLRVWFWFGKGRDTELRHRTDSDTYTACNLQTKQFSESVDPLVAMATCVYQGIKK